MLITFAYNQAQYPGAGDVDDCWVVATIQCARSCASWIEKPTIPEFRAAAGDPDDGVSDGGTLTEVMRGVSRMWPKLPVTEARAWSWTRFAALMKDGPRAASLAIVSSALPSTYRYGFDGLHQVSVFFEEGFWYIVNPLQPEGSSPRRIEEYAVRNAATAYGNGYVFAAVFPTRSETKEAYAMTMFRELTAPGSYYIKAGVAARGYRPRADGEGWEVAKTRAKTTTNSPRYRFEKRLLRISGTAVPSSLIFAVDGPLMGLYVSTAEIEETYDVITTVPKEDLDKANAEVNRLSLLLSAANAEAESVASVLRQQADALTT